MNSNKPRPLIARRTHPRCPVCGEISYSLAGVHPQCAVRQADEQRLRRLKRKPAERKKPGGRSGVRPWERLCPKCKSVQHVRKKVCVCGHTFPVRAHPPAADREES